jgi:hypothetical protein
MSDTAVATALKSPIETIRDKTTIAFRAKLLRLGSQSTWSTTDLADRLLARLGVTKLTARWLLTQQRISEPDFTFLSACIEDNQYDDIEWALSRNSLLRAALYLCQQKEILPEISANARRRLLYSTIVGLNPMSRQLGAQAYFDKVLADLDVSVVGASEKPGLYQNLALSCKRGIFDASHSNVFLIPHHGAQRTQDNTSAFYLTWTRLLSALTAGRVDPILRTAKITPTETSMVWSKLCDWNGAVEKHTIAYVDYFGRLPKLESHRSNFELLVHALTEVFSKSEIEGEASSQSRFSLSEPEKASRTRTFGVWISWLDQLYEGISAGAFDQASQQERNEFAEKLCGIAENVRRQPEVKGTSDIKTGADRWN